MPIYEYACTDCGHRFEELVSMNDRDGAQSCPACGRKAVRRKLSVFSAHQDMNRQATAPGPCSQCEHLNRCAGGRP